MKFISIRIIAFTRAIFGSYLLFAIYVSLSHIGGSRLYLPFNTLYWIFTSLIVGIASCKSINQEDYLLGINKIVKMLKIEPHQETLFCSGGGTRTPDKVVNSHLLYQLSYSGKIYKKSWVIYG